MRISVNDRDIEQSVHAQKRILLDTMILCYAHDRLSPCHAEASLIVKASVNGLIEAYVSYQNLLEFYSVMTGKKVKNPLTPREAAEICVLYAKSVAITKLLPDSATYHETFESAEHLSVTDGDVFDCVLAHTARGNADIIWTENIRHFKKYGFISVENPLEWKWEEK
jgi:predicted nucleic acid-binding protein